MRNVVIALLVLVSLGAASTKKMNSTAAPAPPAGAINWMSWEDALVKMKTQPRKILVDVYTDWCGWCKRMDASTFQEKQIANYVNKHYYAVKFNAEQKQDIVFNNKTYKFVNNGRRGYHELALEITRGRLSYPTVVFLDENLDIIQPIPGYKNSLEFEQIVTYFGENQHKKTPWETYQASYKPMKKD
jgi:thioredoxin-related protein